jgi:hypothetical protein
MKSHRIDKLKYIGSMKGILIATVACSGEVLPKFK